jgi:gamma-glutamyltranspeptidase/glutathione hydrolase
MGPPSSGGTVLTEMLNILEGFNLTRLGHNTPAYLHVLTESMRLAYLDRARYLGDPEANRDMPLKMLWSKDYAGKLRSRIRMDSASRSTATDIAQGWEGPNTTHLSVVDAEGNAVSLTFTLEGAFGSGIVVDGAGFLLNNEMGDFNPIPGMTDDQGQIGSRPNIIGPGKRMLSSMSPTIVVRNKRPFLVLGTPGGRTIPNTITQVLLNVIDFDMTLEDAVSQRRIHHQWMPDVTSLEEGVLSADSLRVYEAFGHKTEVDFSMKYHEVMAIQIVGADNTLVGVADPRSPDGAALGY